MARAILAALAFAAALPASAGSDYDKRKFEELRLRREHRLAVERVFVECLQRPSTTAKCYPVADKFSEKRLADLRRNGQNTHTFQPY